MARATLPTAPAVDLHIRLGASRGGGSSSSMLPVAVAGHTAVVRRAPRRPRHAPACTPATRFAGPENG